MSAFKVILVKETWNVPAWSIGSMQEGIYTEQPLIAISEKVIFADRKDLIILPKPVMNGLSSIESWEHDWMLELHHGPRSNEFWTVFLWSRSEKVDDPIGNNVSTLRLDAPMNEVEDYFAQLWVAFWKGYRNGRENLPTHGA